MNEVPRFSHEKKDVKDEFSKPEVFHTKKTQTKDGSRLSCPNNQAEARVARKKISSEETQLIQVVIWCKQNKARGYSAIKSGFFPFIKNRRTIDKRLDGKIITDQEKKYCSILLPDEEATLVQYIINKNRCYEGINRADLNELIIKILAFHDHMNKTKKGGRNYRALSRNAKRAVKNKKYVSTEIHIKSISHS